ncbi:BtpA/SgcQ family protein [Agromyces sp. Root81]|uniref:BtpA/SgcQ family protein n=1 Tax=Agromyces sp. Root81 TaxID=1736601 RepID=UPI000A646321|nr:BtpA/SgcQ family protein [Agromyces sp. Root81]
MPASPFLESFSSAHPVLAMLHLKGESAADRMDRARREIDLLWSNGVDAVIVENYFGDTDDVVAVCDYLRTSRPEVVFGVNVLNDDARAFDIADAFGARFMQFDSVAGHLPLDEDADYAAWLAEKRASSSAFLLGGVRFKYQPYRSGRSLEEDLLLGDERSDAIVITGDGTGLETPTAKIAAFRDILSPDAALIVGAGVTPDSCAAQLAIADGVIVGSYLKDTYADTGDVDPQHARVFVDAVRQLIPSRA